MKQQKQTKPIAGQTSLRGAAAVTEGRRAIVTGATGFIGMALCRELLMHGYGVVAVIRPGSSKRKTLESLMDLVMQEKVPERTMQASDPVPEVGTGSLQIKEFPLGDLFRLAEGGTQADVCYHLAWNGSSGQEREQFEAQVSNVAYTADAIRAAKKCGCTKFIGAGSQAEYGIVRGRADEETTVPNPFMMYGAAKLAAYQMGKLVAQQEGISLIWPRIYSVYGRGENPGTLVSYLVDTLQKGAIPQVTECENLWDFTYIDDCVRMLRMLGESPKAKGIFNLSAGEPKPLKEFVKEIRDIVNPETNIAFGAKKADWDRTFWLQPDVTKIREICGACRTSFMDGIQKKESL